VGGIGYVYCTLAIVIPDKAHNHNDNGNDFEI